MSLQISSLSSALEHAIPEQMFVTPENPGEAVSAVKALQKAASQGQRIYHITQANMATALPNLRLDAETLGEIRQALNSGKDVITHTDPVSVPGWQGAGYVITDMETSAGAWKIGGGMNGGAIDPAGFQDFLAWLSLWLGVLGKNIFSAIVDAINTIITIIDALLNCPSYITNFVAYFAISVFLSAALLSTVFEIMGFPLVGVLIAAVFSFVLGAWLSSFKDFQCK